MHQQQKELLRSSRLYKMHTHTQSFKDHTLPSLLIQHQLITLPNANQPLYSPPACCDKSSTLPLGFCSGDGALFSAPLSVFPPLLPLSLPDSCCCSGGVSGFPCCEAGLCCGAPCCCSPACSGAVFVCGSGLLPSCSAPSSTFSGGWLGLTLCGAAVVVLTGDTAVPLLGTWKKYSWNRQVILQGLNRGISSVVPSYLSIRQK